MSARVLLEVLLPIAVARELERLLARGGPHDLDLDWRLKEELAMRLAEKGDVLLYRGKKKGETASAFADLARGVALLAFAPGGVSIFGFHACTGTRDCNGERCHEIGGVRLEER
jgi:hypothetical protein